MLRELMTKYFIKAGTQGMRYRIASDWKQFTTALDVCYDENDVPYKVTSNLLTGFDGLEFALPFMTQEMYTHVAFAMGDIDIIGDF